ncbi:methylenetetrahydrofolate reductase C-terminal domain-containing protein [Maritalea mediterranea]|uniref:Methylenetetrahydrofolate reductase C-terminal domain-containing protein n=1 Tax=Maritalea mediterranea TaxID=2909667 RepID=A0ABS9E6F6_9HYPH|nr:methylenetetrahydrofolate reductase C-terminal domain-containing protein [Maritalea mediterranea]MCF4098456.1 methylenetetrahydrofolate reductase C-terminal domain-containing protein [Maritalea mediterranea]
MYAIRRWSSRHARGLERLYKATRPGILSGLRLVTRLFGKRLDRPITATERLLKGALFDCQMCGDCVLSKTGMTCPMNCPKGIRNGPCGGVRANGMCEVKPDMRCVWVDAWNGAAKMEDGDAIKDIEFAVDHSRVGQSSWLRLARDE